MSVPRSERDERGIIDEDAFNVKVNENGDEVVEIPIDELDSDMQLSKIQVLPESSPESARENIVITKKREDTRGRLALLFLIGFFFCLIGIGIASLIVQPADGSSKIDTLRESILTVSGVLSGPLGFIIGFYFRKAEED